MSGISSTMLPVYEDDNDHSWATLLFSALHKDCTYSFSVCDEIYGQSAKTDSIVGLRLHACVLFHEWLIKLLGK